MVRVAICDDKDSQIEFIQRATEAYFSKQTERVSYSPYRTGTSFFADMRKGGRFDIVLLDAYMPDIPGIEIAKEIRRRKDKTEIIFLAGNNELALEAFSLKAAHYLVKPFIQEQFDEAMNRAILRHNQLRSSKIILRLEGGGIQIAELEEILYIESDSHVQMVHLCDDSTVRIRQTLGQLIKLFDQMEEGQFVSPCKGYIVNQKEIRRIQADHIEMHDGKVVPLAKRKYRQFQEMYFAYIFKRGQYL